MNIESTPPVQRKAGRKQMSAAKLACLSMSLLTYTACPLGQALAADVAAAPEEIVIVGRQPGPPLWRISHGDNVLWIFPYLDWVPRDMLWDEQRVARVIAQSQEVIGLPGIEYTLSPLVALNPFNVVRGTRMFNRLERYPDGSTLEANLPPELYARYAVLQARYFPHERGYAVMHAREVGRRMMHIIRERNDLVPGSGILATIRRLVRRNDDIRLTDMAIEVELGSYRDYVDRVEALYESFPAELEHACFEQQVRRMEAIEETKRRANDWAQGDIDEFRSDEFYTVSLAIAESSACDELYVGSLSPVRENVTHRREGLAQAWLDAAENALGTNASTFAILPINELLAGDGLLSKLREKGYEVREP